jgi:transposase
MKTQKSFAQRQARVRRPERFQVEMHLKCLDQMLPREHRCRIVWKFVSAMDLDPFYAEIRVSDSQPGRTAIAPEILFALWLLATLDGISSARELGRRCETDMPYLWICGGVSVNYHTLSDFRVQHSDKLDQILTDTIASLMHQGLVKLDELGQDGMRVRAHAGGGSFRRKPTLEKLHAEAKKHIEQLSEEAKTDASQAAQVDARHQAARQRAARQREQRVQQALEDCDELAKKREKRKKGDGPKTRTSTTDPDARRMKMGDGGFRPAYNVQFASDADARVIVGVEVNNEGTDGAELGPMLDQVKDRYGKTPETILVDSAYANNGSVDAADRHGTIVVSTVPRAEVLIKNGKDPHARQRKDSDAFAAFRVRMAQAEYQELYKKRPSIAEFPNADCRNRGLHQFRVRGPVKAKAVALWHALAFDFMRMIDLGATEVAT